MVQVFLTRYAAKAAISAVPQVWWYFPPSLASLYHIWLTITKHALVQNRPFWFQSRRVSRAARIIARWVSDAFFQKVSQIITSTNRDDNSIRLLLRCLPPLLLHRFWFLDSHNYRQFRNGGLRSAKVFVKRRFYLAEIRVKESPGLGYGRGSIFRANRNLIWWRLLEGPFPWQVRRWKMLCRSPCHVSDKGD